MHVSHILSLVTVEHRERGTSPFVVPLRRLCLQSVSVPLTPTAAPSLFQWQPLSAFKSTPSRSQGYQDRSHGRLPQINIPNLHHCRNFQASKQSNTVCYSGTNGFIKGGMEEKITTNQNKIQNYKKTKQVYVYMTICVKNLASIFVKIVTYKQASFISPFVQLAWSLFRNLALNV